MEAESLALPPMQVSDPLPPFSAEALSNLDIVRGGSHGEGRSDSKDKLKGGAGKDKQFQ